jgi:hypothetical protein
MWKEHTYCWISSKEKQATVSVYRIIHSSNLVAKLLNADLVRHSITFKIPDINNFINSIWQFTDFSVNL